MSAHTFDHYEPVGYYQRGSIEDRPSKMLGTHMYVSDPPPPPEKCTAREGRVQRFTPGYAGWPVGELQYFPMRWHAESLRLLMHHAGQAYTLKTIAFAEWPAVAVSELIPGGTLPAFTPDGGACIGEALEIAKYLAKVSGVPGLLPTAAAAAASAEKLFAMSAAAPFSQTGKLLNEVSAQEAAAQAPAHVKDAIAALKAAEPALRAGGGPFCGGKAPHYGDFGLWAAVDALKALDPRVVKQLGGAWAAWYAAVADLDGVKSYLACRTEAGTGKVGKSGSLIATKAVDAKPAKALKNFQTEYKL